FASREEAEVVHLLVATVELAHFAETGDVSHHPSAAAVFLGRDKRRPAISFAKNLPRAPAGHPAGGRHVAQQDSAWRQDGMDAPEQLPDGRFCVALVEEEVEHFANG